MAGLSGLIVSVLAVAVQAPIAKGAVHERVKLNIPESGQLAAARLEFKVKGEKKPKLKIKAKNAGALPGGIVAAAQMARSTANKGRAVALVAIGNVPSAAARNSPRVTAESMVVDVRAAGAGQNVTDIEFQNLPSASRNFLSVLGLEPQAERAEAQDVFRLPESKIPNDPFGRLDLAAAANTMDLDLTGPAKVIAPPKGLQEELEALQLIQSAIGGAVGPPAALDGRIYELITGRPRPVFVDVAAFPSPSNPSVFFTSVQYGLPVMGAQVSQAGDNALLDTADARCQNGSFNDGLVTRGSGPLLTFGFSYRLDCRLPQRDRLVFFDVPLERPPDPGIDLFKFMPFPEYGDDELGEAVAGEQVTFLVRG